MPDVFLACLNKDDDEDVDGSGDDDDSTPSPGPLYIVVHCE